MLVNERQTAIMNILNRTKSIRISDIVDRFSVSNETARRDLETLQDQKLIKRIYGGAILIEPEVSEQQYNARLVQSHRQKVCIGRAAAELVNPGETIILDIGTTTLEIARHLKHLSNITVLTNSLPILNELANTQISLFALGGRLNADELSMHGQLTIDALQHFYVDKAFIGAGGVTLDGGISDYNSEPAHVRQAIMKRSNQTILVADSGKFGTNAFAVVCGVSELDMVVSDDMLPQSFQDALLKMNIKVILASTEGAEIIEND